jgi:pyruvate kinase
MLSGETAAGKFPVEAVATMARIIGEAEIYRWSPLGREGWAARLSSALASSPLRPGQTESVNPSRDIHFEIPDIVCGAAVEAASRLGGAPVVAFSQGGFTARMIARYRPAAPILVFTNDAQVARRIQLVWGVRPQVLSREVHELSEVVTLLDRHLVAEGLVKAGQAIVILMGEPIRDRPLTNLMRVHRVRGR